MIHITQLIISNFANGFYPWLVGSSKQPSTSSLSISLSQLDRQVFIFDCMLEHICSIYEIDKTKQKRMYEGVFEKMTIYFHLGWFDLTGLLVSALRKFFVASQLLPPENFLPEMNGSRIQVKLGLSSLFSQIQSNLINSNETESAHNSLTIYRPNNTR